MNVKTCCLCGGRREIMGSNMIKISCPSCKGIGQVEIIDNVEKNILRNDIPTDGAQYNISHLSPSGTTDKELQLIIKETDPRNLEDIPNSSSKEETCAQKKRPGRPKSLKNKNSEQKAYNE